MELQKFIEESIKQVVSSINKCTEFARENGAEINPYQQQWRHGEGWYFDKASGRPMTNIEFDVAVTAADGKQTKGGIGISVASVVLGSSGQSESINWTGVGPSQLIEIRNKNPKTPPQITPISRFLRVKWAL